MQIRNPSVINTLLLEARICGTPLSTSAMRLFISPAMVQ